MEMEMELDMDMERCRGADWNGRFGVFVFCFGFPLISFRGKEKVKEGGGGLLTCRDFYVFIDVGFLKIYTSAT